MKRLLWVCFAAAMAATVTRPAALWAEPLPENTALARPVTVASNERPVAEIVAQLSRQTAVALSVDAVLANTPLTVGANGRAARDVMAAMAAALQVEWEPRDNGALHLAAPAILPSPVDTNRLATLLESACPISIRPQPGATGALPAALLLPPMDAVYASLRRPLLDAIEEGGEVPSAEIPASSRRMLADCHRERSRQAIAAAVHPRWRGAPLAALALEYRPNSFGSPLPGWVLTARSETSAGTPLLGIPYYPGRRPAPVQEPLMSGRRLRDVALEIARDAGAGIVVASEAGARPAPEPVGKTAAERLASLLPGGERAPYAWQPVGSVYWLRTNAAVVAAPELARARQSIERGVPAEYRSLFAMTPGQRALAIQAPWVKLIESLPRDGSARTPPVQDLSEEQQAWLLAALQAQMVAATWSAVESALSGSLERSTLALDFEGLADLTTMNNGMGYRRVLLVRDGATAILSGPISNALLLLPLYPSGESGIHRRADLSVKDEALADVAARLSEMLDAPLALNEPGKALRLTGEFRDKPLLLMLHWVERRTNLRWSKLDGVCILSPPDAAAAVARDPSAAVQALWDALPVKPGAWRSEYPVTLTAEDRAALQQGPVPLSALSPGAREAILQQVSNRARAQLDRVTADSRVLARLGEAYLRLSPEGTASQPLLFLDLPHKPGKLTPVPGTNGLIMRAEPDPEAARMPRVYFHIGEQP